MTTFTVKTKNDTMVNIEVSEVEISNFINDEIKKLQDKLDSLKVMDFNAAGQLAVNSFKNKLNKLEQDDKLADSYSYDELKSRASGASFTGYLAELGIEKSLHGSATRALALGKAALAGLKIAKIDDPTVMRTVAENAIGGKNSLWRDSVIEWLLHSEADAE